MTFSNPARTAKESASAYRQALLDLLGERDPLTVMAEQVDALRELTGSVDADVLRRSESPGRWSVQGVMQHLVDTEAVYAVRYRLIAAQDRPVIAGFDQDRWVSDLGYLDIDNEVLLRELQTFRQRNLRLLYGLPPEARGRVGRHEERGAESLEDMIKLGAAHDLVHRSQIERILSNVLHSS